MSDIIDKIIKDIEEFNKNMLQTIDKDIQFHRRNIDNFNKDMLKSIDKTNKEVVAYFTNIVQPMHQEPSKQSHVTPASSPSRTRSNHHVGRGIFNPFDE